MLKIIKTDGEYDEALVQVDELLELNSDEGTADSERLGILLLLLDQYDQSNYPTEYPDPIEAIKFRMEQEGLSQRDLVPLLGSASKVSEVLSRKRPLSLSMIRALHDGLKIPARVLINRPTPRSSAELDWSKFPIKELVKRGWIDLSDKVADPIDSLKSFFGTLGPARSELLLKRSEQIRSARSMDDYALMAWTAKAVSEALESPPTGEYDTGSITLEWMREIAKLSLLDRGPRLACEVLSKYGVSVVIVPHLPKTYLDGACISAGNEFPVIALSIRHDRLDNFWYTLMHELAHVALHLGKGFERFYDDLEVRTESEIEKEADELAGEALIPKEIWERSPASKLPTPQAVEHLAKKLMINPAIVAGKVRYESNSYRVLSDLIGQGKARREFPEVRW